MNEHLTISSVGLQLIAAFEGAPRLKARLCEGGRWELSYGCTTWPDGRAVCEGETCTEEQAVLLFDYHLDVFEAVVRKHVTVDLTQPQFDALVALAYNIGEEQYASSTVVRMTNAKRWEDAAEGFGLWIKATRTFAQRQPSEPLAWYLSPDSKPCSYRRALRGLVRRHYAEACVYLGFDWAAACADDAVFLRTERVWNAEKGRNEDRVLAKTEFADVRNVARLHPLQAPVVIPVPDAIVLTLDPAAPPAAAEPPHLKESEISEHEDAVASKTTAQAAPATPMIVIEKPVIQPPLALPKPPVTIDVSKLQLNNIRVENGAKPMEVSDRAIAFAIKATGVFVKIQARRGLISMPVAETLFDVMGDAFIMSCVIAGGVWCAGRIAQAFGSWQRNRFLRTARTLTY